MKQPDETRDAPPEPLIGNSECRRDGKEICIRVRRPIFLKPEFALCKNYQNAVNCQGNIHYDGSDYPKHGIVVSEGDSLDVIRRFPGPVKQDLGAELRRLQEGDRPQPRISELLNGKLSKMSAEKLAGYLSRLGVEIKISAHKAD